MAILRTNDKQVEVGDNSSIIDAAKELDVPFGCHSGLCGTCRIEVLEGMENLSEKTPEENDLGCEGKERQACQCQIKNGIVTIQC
ncbi:(2Fe-2S)-binding protein [Candidatus Woesearchaeota archaeon]|nr:(2Fe-2S)-binding protein [Candidatus Woesearchaeota archaeon]